ncbi:LysM peptidoglycan-binding domain-containing protein [Peptoniphilus sp. MSJ-1]|uniref:LysM peptidoglycan-binding domain-containing protein n=1 Tax=Peptoniphilus ovalis TaxID=2841503 RepID=A0ABS6FFV1_9FIRM|nr:LysM peptidoglycan-binding domain-containing protein [Peptoniphilus ovalis]MBU5669051.1 LysM peptidoglycan-binding domain-containing protein [Peptoniphilus ovalis]
MKKVRIYKTKVLLFLFTILIFNLGLIVTGENNINPIKNNEKSFVIYTVKSGDTFWTIANNYNYSNKMKFISDIERINNLNSESLKPGYKIAIPIYKSK